jgi:hypothetical protein
MVRTMLDINSGWGEEPSRTGSTRWSLGPLSLETGQMRLRTLEGAQAFEQDMQYVCSFPWYSSIKESP